MRLHVREFRPRAWFLLGDLERDGEDYYLDVACSRGPVGFSLLVKLSDEERGEYHEVGRVYLDYLAAKISGQPDRYRNRDLTRELGDGVTGTIVKFKESRTDVDW